ncbi:hypothetical protein SAMN05444487_10235 [Marininema mesophilum]|uniref:Uncharacterized protein n=1 Tax=Marininema mesophilum TaxID=1048340 RepID=A0A1H2RZ79_9BACL|nr:hypothetical protein SAMN05444487_10235 [Marininema mesophilum]
MKLWDIIIAEMDVTKALVDEFFSIMKSTRKCPGVLFCVVLLSHHHSLGSEVIIMRKAIQKEYQLRIVRETFGNKEIKDAFKKALEPYFLSNDDLEIETKHSKVAVQ